MRMAAEVCSRFGGYPSDYIFKKTIGQLYFDHKFFLALIEGEEKALRSLSNGQGIGNSDNI